MARRRSLSAPPLVDVGPISTLNTTPLIHVMLVLLIMFIVTIPLTTHNLKLDLPTGPVSNEMPPPVHRLTMDAAGRLTWDGAALPEAALASRLAVLKAEDGELHFRADGEARYEDFNRVLSLVKRAEIGRLGLIDNARFIDNGAF
jgi:biopolymer transport protein ExbD